MSTDVHANPGAAADTMPLVSVVIAAYNAAPYISETCASVLRQTHRHLEVIVVDDGSTDETGQIVTQLAAADSRVRLIRQDNQGVAAARNRGIKEATGEFIAPLDADDLWDVHKLERQVQRFHEAGSETGVVYCWWVWIDAKGYVLDRSPRWHVEGRVLERLVEVNFTGSASIPLFRRSCVVELGGYNADLRDNGAQGCEDWDLALRVAERYTVAVVPVVLVGYRRHPGSMSAKFTTMWRSQNLVMEAIATRQPRLSNDAFRRSNGQFALHLAGVAFWSRNYVEAIKWGLRARPFSLSLTVLPHVLRIFTKGVRSSNNSHRPRWTQGDRALDEATLPEPLIPYDAIYARYWHGRGHE